MHSCCSFGGWGELLLPALLSFTGYLQSQLFPEHGILNISLWKWKLLLWWAELLLTCHPASPCSLSSLQRLLTGSDYPGKSSHLNALCCLHLQSPSSLPKDTSLGLQGWCGVLGSVILHDTLRVTQTLEFWFRYVKTSPSTCFLTPYLRLKVYFKYFLLQLQGASSPYFCFFLLFLFVSGQESLFSGLFWGYIRMELYFIIHFHINECLI